MKRFKQPGLHTLLVMGLLSALYLSCSAPDHDKPHLSAKPRVVTYDPAATHYQEIFDAARDTVIFDSGVVTLELDKSAELHSTEDYEELIVVLSGMGEVRITDGKTLPLKYGSVAFIPQHTEHLVHNTGTDNLRYIYVAVEGRVKN